MEDQRIEFEVNKVRFEFEADEQGEVCFNELFHGGGELYFLVDQGPSEPRSIAFTLKVLSVVESLLLNWIKTTKPDEFRLAESSNFRSSLYRQLNFRISSKLDSYTLIHTNGIQVVGDSTSLSTNTKFCSFHSLHLQRN